MQKTDGSYPTMQTAPVCIHVAMPAIQRNAGLTGSGERQSADRPDYCLALRRV